MYTTKGAIAQLSDDDNARKLLTDLLKEAAQLEHCLLDAYLFTACSLKSTPKEFKTINGKLNRRRAIQFERARAWKKTILSVCHEEMLHLHYVECLIRALGEQPYFGLPERDPKTNNWLFGNWKAKIGKETAGGGKGVEIPVTTLSMDNIMKFVLYESTDALQDLDPFGRKVMGLFQKLHDFEMDLQFEGALFYIKDDKERAKLKGKLRDLYYNLPPIPIKSKRGIKMLTAEVKDAGLPSVKDLRFQSIADFYYKGIQPLYEQAFNRGWVKYDNWKLNNELLDPQYAQQGFLPIGPTGTRPPNFIKFSKDNTEDPLSDFKDVKDIIAEIVEEGEGAGDFLGAANQLLEKIAEVGARGYAKALMAQSSRKQVPDWLYGFEMLRNSHLYNFMVIMMDVRQEVKLAEAAGLKFSAARDVINVKRQVGLQDLTAEIPLWFNAVYLTMISWLSRIYEVQEWEADKASRKSIESLVSWPLMSIAIRPFLELASFFPLNQSKLFKLDGSDLPDLPIHVRQLFNLYNSPKRSEEINKQIDYFAVRVLEDAAKWAGSQIEVVERSKMDEHSQRMILARLNELSLLGEFKKQLPFREAGGFSDTMPDIAFDKSSKHKKRYEESPTLPKNTPLFNETLALRLRFSGWGLVQLATDPDPTFDETGATGTNMFHPADGEDKRFDKALVWQNYTPSQNIVRGPTGVTPELGVNCTDISLLVTNPTAQAGYMPLQAMNSTGAVQASGVQQKAVVSGFLNLLDIQPSAKEKLRVFLETKDDVRPFLNGLNHIIWQDGEPIDPFIFSLYQGDKNGKGDLIASREVYNEGKSIIDMEPLQRIYSSRAPVGFDSYQNIPSWVMKYLSPELKKQMASPGYSMNFIVDRVMKLGNALSAVLSKGGAQTQERVDTIVSYYSRMELMVVQPAMTMIVWLQFLLHYGHTISGILQQGDSLNKLLGPINKATGLNLELGQTADRNSSNSRWFLNYTKGVMDVDALSDLVFGELYIPVTLKDPDQSVSLSWQWRFNREMIEQLQRNCCAFQRPFWAKFSVQGKKRKTTLPDGTVITETLQQKDVNGYTYTMSGIPDLESYTGKFNLRVSGKMIYFSWDVTFKCASTKAAVYVAMVVGGGANAIDKSLRSIFGPLS